jgi:NADPH:quinone reductase-like Zn-dependent oxidoreductase
MRAAVLRNPGPPSVLKLETLPVPIPTASQLLLKVQAFGLNRSEMFTRQGHSPITQVPLPRVLGIEAVGTAVACPDGQIPVGSTVAVCMGGMGRIFDGGYAEYTVVPVEFCCVLETKLDWEVLGALPEMIQTAYGSLFRSLRIKEGERLLIRGGTTSVGFAAAGLAKNFGCYVAATTRSEDNKAMLLECGVDEVIIDDGSISSKLSESQKFDKVLELIGVTTLKDSLRCVVEGGVVCETGIVGNKWQFETFDPMELIPTAVCLTIFAGFPGLKTCPLQKIVEDIEAGKLKVKIGKVFNLDQIAEAHQCMEENRAGGKIVVLT